VAALRCLSRTFRPIAGVPLLMSTLGLSGCGPTSTLKPTSGSLLAVSADSVPLSGEWRFAVDPDEVGESKGWAAPDFDDSG